MITTLLDLDSEAVEKSDIFLENLLIYIDTSRMKTNARRN